MGNCCTCTEPQQGHPKHSKRDKGSKRLQNSADAAGLQKDDSRRDLQHIKDREPDDLNDDPSLHPTSGPLFVNRATENGELPVRRSKSRSHLIPVPLIRNGIRKSSSCSTIFLDDSTISQPNLKFTIKAVALAIYYHIKNRSAERSMSIFDERERPLSREGPCYDVDRAHVEHRNIYRFVRLLFQNAQLTAECAVVTLVYLERLLTYAELDMTPATWRRMVLGATLLASKVWDDQAVWNVDYCGILKDTSVDDMNDLERVILEMLQFNVNVPSPVYAKYYFHLRSLAEANDLALHILPLSKERAERLEAMSSLFEGRLTSSYPKTKRSVSLDAFPFKRGIPVIP
ncbi:unnamed protein product [Cyprideis torosa]|uniref:Uncharacterized protein n=1 Tax=Cyprideis torosa TaxID=163714 RepID=A0A7R8ZQG7_9CRUS|nr:unnamed protein product [Cyprideis torosa]CAG0896345.1 unnamed protein product [Cyprideis torosa]